MEATNKQERLTAIDILKEHCAVIGIGYIDSPVESVVLAMQAFAAQEVLAAKERAWKDGYAKALLGEIIATKEGQNEDTISREEYEHAVNEIGQLNVMYAMSLMIYRFKINLIIINKY